MNWLKDNFHHMWNRDRYLGSPWQAYTSLFDTISNLGLVDSVKFRLQSDAIYDQEAEPNKDCWCDQCTEYDDPHTISVFVETDRENVDKWQIREYRVDL